MHHNHHSFHPTHPTPSMSSSHPYTVVDDEDDTDICPVCDGQCTCRLKYQPTSPAPIPSLKIKFTLPPSLIAKRRLDTPTNNQQTTSPYTTLLKKRGRPPKHTAPPTHPKPPPSPAKLDKVRQNIKARAAISTKKVVNHTTLSDHEQSYFSDTLKHPRRIYQRKQHNNFPTFVSASALSSISTTSDSSSSDFDTDSDIQAEEENFIVADIHDKARLRRELLGSDDPHLKKRSPTHHNSDWVIRPRKKSVGGSDAEQMDVDSDATDNEAQNENDEDGAEDDDDEDDEDEDEPDGINGVEEVDEDTDGRHHYVGLATGWSEEEDESSFDADLFFANLSDSSSNSSSSSTSTRRRCCSYTPGGIDADQSSSTSESPTRTALESLPFEVTENWDGQLIFTNGPVGEAESRGIVDIDFEKDAERFIVDSDPDDDHYHDGCSSSSYQKYDPSSAAQVPESSDIDMFSISDADAGYEEEDGGEADEGDTTDEELVGDDCLPNERAMRLFTLPMPIPISMGMGIGISAINPMSTVSPSVGFEKRKHARRMDVDGDREERKRWRRRWRLGASGSPRAADILAGKIVLWSAGFAGSGDGYASSSSASSNSMIKAGKGKRKQKSSFSPSSSHLSNTCRTQIPSTPRTGLFIPTGETRQAVIGDDRKGTDVPSPHPRFIGRRSRVSVVQCQHQQSQSSATNRNSGSSPSDTPSPCHHLLSSAAASPLTGAEDFTSTTNTNANGGEEYDTGSPCPAEVEVDNATCIVELDDVLEASFLDDSMDRECEAGVGSTSLTPTSGTNSGLVEDSTVPTTTASTDSTAAAAAAADASNKHLTRWDVISIGAFRQTREQQQQVWGPGSRSSSAVADYGSVIKTGASALLWQNSGAGSTVGSGVGGRAGSSKKTSSSSLPTTSTSTPKTSTSRSKGSSTKAAKRRRLMMTSSTMSSPLVLPLSSASLTTPPSKSHSSSLSSHSHSHSHSQPNPTSTHKNRRELRREKKLLKKSSSSQSIPQQPSFFSTHHHPYAAHPNNASSNNNHYHTHQHYPNLKTRGASSSQRMGFFGGAVPPLNL